MEQNRFSNVQLELLKVYSHQVSDADLSDLKVLLAHFFADKAIVSADAAWDERKWDAAHVQQLLETKLRTPYL